MDKITKRSFSFKIYRREVFLLFIILMASCSYCLIDAQLGLDVAASDCRTGIWCRMFYALTNTYWIGTAYWAAFFLCLNSVLSISNSRYALVRWKTKRNWENAIRYRICFFVFLYALTFFFILYIDNVCLYGWNAMEIEKSVVLKLFGGSIEKIVISFCTNVILISIAIALFTWILILIFKSVHYCILFMAGYCIFSCMAYSTFVLNKIEYIFLPAGITLTWILKVGLNRYMIIVIAISALILFEILVIYLLNNKFINKAEIEDYVK